MGADSGAASAAGASGAAAASAAAGGSGDFTSGTNTGTPASGTTKQRRIAELANAYIRRHRLQDCQVRIDVVAVTFAADGEPVVEHFENAFESP